MSVEYKIYDNKKRLHNRNTPAMIDYDGTKFWYKRGKLHRDDGPAVEYVSGLKWYYQNGIVHRSDGPALEWPEKNIKEYYIYGVKTFSKNPLQKLFNE